HRDGRLLLADRHVEAVHVLALLIDDRIDRDRGLAGTAVSDDELALTAANRDHRVDRFDPGLHRLVHALARNDARRFDLDLAAMRTDQRLAAIDRRAHRVHYAAE